VAALVVLFRRAIVFTLLLLLLLLLLRKIQFQGIEIDQNRRVLNYTASISCGAPAGLCSALLCSLDRQPIACLPAHPLSPGLRPLSRKRAPTIHASGPTPEMINYNSDVCACLCLHLPTLFVRYVEGHRGGGEPVRHRPLPLSPPLHIHPATLPPTGPGHKRISNGPRARNRGRRTGGDQNDNSGQARPFCQFLCPSARRLIAHLRPGCLLAAQGPYIKIPRALPLHVEASSPRTHTHLEIPIPNSTLPSPPFLCR